MLDRSYISLKSVCDADKTVEVSGCQETSSGTLCTCILMPTWWTPGTQHKRGGEKTGGIKRKCTFFEHLEWQHATVELE